MRLTDAEIISLCQDALFAADSTPGDREWVKIDRDKWFRAVSAINGQVLDEPPPEWVWSSLRREWTRTEKTT